MLISSAFATCWRNEKSDFGGQRFDLFPETTGLGRCLDRLHLCLRRANNVPRVRKSIDERQREGQRFTEALHLRKTTIFEIFVYN